MKCSKCDSANGNDATLCKSCGNPLLTIPQSSTIQKEVDTNVDLLKEKYQEEKVENINNLPGTLAGEITLYAQQKQLNTDKKLDNINKEILLHEDEMEDLVTELEIKNYNREEKIKREKYQQELNLELMQLEGEAKKKRMKAENEETAKKDTFSTEEKMSNNDINITGNHHAITGDIIGNKKEINTQNYTVNKYNIYNPSPTTNSSHKRRKYRMVSGIILIIILLSIIFLVNRKTENKDTNQEQIYISYDINKEIPSSKTEIVGKHFSELQTQEKTATKEPIHQQKEEIEHIPIKKQEEKQQQLQPILKIQPDEINKPEENEPIDFYREGLKLYNQFLYEEAFGYFLEAAEKGEAGAQYYLGIMYLNGNGLKKNETIAFNYIRQAAEKDHKEAIHQLAQMYDGGRGTDKDKKQARIWYQKSADRGNMMAQRRLNNL